MRKKFKISRCVDSGHIQRCHLFSFDGFCCFRLMRLRNPWGRTSWKGSWSDKSSLWTDELRQNLEAYGSDEGLFWISLEDIMKWVKWIQFKVTIGGFCFVVVVVGPKNVYKLKQLGHSALIIDSNNISV